MTTKSDIKLRRHWLCYSLSTNKAYCHPCWLFGTNSGVALVTGFDDRQHLSSRLQSHEESKQHLEACKIHETWCSRGIIDDVMDSSIFEKKKIIGAKFYNALSMCPYPGYAKSCISRAQKGEREWKPRKLLISDWVAFKIRPITRGSSEQTRGKCKVLAPQTSR